MSLTSRPAELTLPVAALTALRRELVAELGEDRAAEILEEAGRAAGDVLVTLVEAALPAGSVNASGDALEADRLAAAPASAFWNTLTRLLAARGWGHLTFESAHPGLGSLDSIDLAESDAAAPALRPSCHFTAGMLAHVLGNVARETVAVLEVECRARGDLRCRFLFGGAPALEAVHAGLVAGQPLEATLEAMA
ncbi:MAG TPA: 4-vinyl reductase [Longimicrobiales bacterium]|nr:4-vinyl reductase [Longimicrobiales bacterium]